MSARLTPCRTPRKHTAQMTRAELARTWAAHHGLLADPFGWLRLADHTPVAQGYESLGKMLESVGVVLPGCGIDWHKADEDKINPTFVRQMRLARCDQTRREVTA